jgi:hypothetical protein
MVIEVEEMKKSSIGSVKYVNEVTRLNPTELSKISIANLLSLVKVDAKKYIPTAQDNSDTMTQKRIAEIDKEIKALKSNKAQSGKGARRAVPFVVDLK